MTTQCRRARALVPSLALALLSAHGVSAFAQSAPASVGIPGSYQSGAGCGGDWDPGCSATQLVYDANGDVWRNTFSITPAGAYEYKVALNGSWDVNFGLHAQQNGPNIPLATSASPQNVTFYYDHKTHWVADNVSSITRRNCTSPFSSGRARGVAAPTARMAACGGLITAVKR